MAGQMCHRGACGPPTPRHRLTALAHISTLLCCPLIQEHSSQCQLGKHSQANRNRILMSPSTVALVFKDNFLEIIISVLKVSCPCWKLIKEVSVQNSLAQTLLDHTIQCWYFQERKQGGKKISLYLHRAPWLEHWERSWPLELHCLIHKVYSRTTFSSWNG